MSNGSTTESEKKLNLMACCSSGCSRDPTGTLSCLLAHLCAGASRYVTWLPTAVQNCCESNSISGQVRHHIRNLSPVPASALPENATTWAPSCQNAMSCPTHSPSDLSGSHLPHGGPKPCPVLDFPRVFLLRDLRNPTCPTAWSARTPKTRERVPRPCRRTAPQRTARIYCATRWQHAACCRRDCAHLRRS